jgi:tetratricopeptide (TPR) repeat protein
VTHIAQCYGLLGAASSGKKDFNLAYDYTLKANHIYNQTNASSRAKIKTISNLGALCKALKKYQDAHDYLNLALIELQKHFGLNSFEVLYIYNELGLLNKEQRNLTVAIEYFEKYYELSRLLNSKVHQSQSMAELGAIYFEMKSFNKAIEYYDKGFSISKKYSFLKWKADCFLQMKEINKALNIYLMVLDEWQIIYGSDDSDVYELINLTNGLKQKI